MNFKLRLFTVPVSIKGFGSSNCCSLLEATLSYKSNSPHCKLESLVSRMTSKGEKVETSSGLTFVPCQLEKRWRNGESKVYVF